MNDEFVKEVLSSQYSVLSYSVSLEANSHSVCLRGSFAEYRVLSTEYRVLLSVCRFLLRHMPQAAAFDQAVEIFGEIGGMVAGALQSLRHQDDFKVGCVALGHGF